MANFKATKIEVWEEYAVIDFCEERDANNYDIAETKKDVNTDICANGGIYNEKCYKSGDHDGVLSGLNGTSDDKLYSIMEKTDEEVEIQKECRVEKYRTYPHVIINDRRYFPIANQEAPWMKECCHTGCHELGISSEKTAADLFVQSPCGKKLTVDSLFSPEEKMPQKLPNATRTFWEKLRFIEAGIHWIRSELKGLREVDQKLIETFSQLLSQSRRLKKIEETFLEQQEILEEIDDIIEKEEFENLHLLDKPIISDIRVGIQKKVSNVDRYIRIGRVGRRASHY